MIPIGGRTVGDVRVRINTAGSDELNESLPGIEPEQARLIVAYREEHGYLRGPEDLGRIEGIDRETVAALAPYIDWSVPPDRAEIHQREWGWALAAAVTLLAFLWQLAFGSLPALVRAIPSSEPLGIWDATADTAILAGLALGLAALVAYFLTENQRRARKTVLFSVAGFGVAVLAYASVALVTASRFLFLDPDWVGLRSNPQDLVIFPLAVAFALVALPVLLVLWRPAFAASHRLARLFDMGWLSQHSGWCSRSGRLGVLLPHGSRS
jgi:competence ComEA-like helix-hairpin-helix protein